METSNQTPPMFVAPTGTALHPRDAPRGLAEAPHLFADVVNLRCALAASERRLAATLRQLDSLRARDADLMNEVVALTETAANGRRFAYHDELTGLPNRHLLLDRFNQAVAFAARHQRHVALLFLDLDRFKSINDTLGHSAGDCLLQQVGARLLGGVRTSDTVCRYDGDEFVVLLPELPTRDSAVVVAEKIRVHLTTPYIIDGTTITMTTSIGLGVFPEDGRGYGDLIHIADVATYRHKARRPAPPIILDRAADAAQAQRPAPSALGSAQSAAK